jgi:hypothetical protein
MKGAHNGYKFPGQILKKKRRLMEIKQARLLFMLLPVPLAIHQ